MKTAASKKTVFDMTQQEFKELIRPVAEQVLQETWEKDAFITYYDEKICPDTDTLVQEYKDHSELVRIDGQGKAMIIKQLTDDRPSKNTTDYRSGTERGR